jgi:DNA-binding LacI/PurR family transcriptional regulator
MTDSQPLAAERRRIILAALAREGVVRNAELVAGLDVTPVTLRRDLAQLEQEGLLTRVHGGAVAALGARARGVDDDGAIAVLVPSLSFYWPTVARGIEAGARRGGFRVVLRGASYEPLDERPALRRLIETDGVRGVIVAPNTDAPHAQDVLQWLAGCGVPVVLAERDGVALPNREPLESATSDHALGAMLAARHLAALGHRRVGLLSSRTSPTSRKIEAGWHSACDELGMSSSQHFERQLPPHTSGDFAAAVDATLDTVVAEGTTGLLVHSDAEAMALVERALARGISVPHDLSVIAYDDELAELFTPALTAVSPPRVAVGEAAAELILARIADPTRPARRVVLSPSLVVRASTAPPVGG